MADVRIPRGYARYQTPYLEVMEGQRPSLDEQATKALRPAPWLPTVVEDKVHDDNIVIQAGTWVGRINATDHADAFTAAASAWQAQYLVPAFQGTGEYSLTYTTLDTDADGSYSVPDIDNWPTAVSAAGTSTITIPPVKPMGVAYQDMFGSYYSLRYKNYERQSMVGFLTYGQIIMVPAQTAAEAAIQPGDLCVVHRSTDASPTWKPRDAANYVGHLKAYDSSTDSLEYKVGQCVEKITIAGGGSAGQRLSAAVTAGSATGVHSFGGLANVQTVPGLGLQGSGTLGIPGFLLNAVSQSTYFYGLMIRVGVQ
jgi:hypothetical protein